MNGLTLVLVVLLLVLFSGCANVEKQIEPTKQPLNDSNKEIITGPQDSLDENKEIKETTPTSAPEQTSNKLEGWVKEERVRIGGVSSCTIIKSNEYWMYFTGNGIELAKSSDGLNFAYAGTVVNVKDISGLDMVTNPTVFGTKDGKYRVLFEGSKMLPEKNDRKVYSAISPDGLTWTVEEGVRFQDAGDGKPGELFTSVPDTIRLEDGRLRMYYTRGATSATALSIDEGLTWTKENNLKLRNIAIDPDIVLLDNNTYKLFFSTFENEFGTGEQWITSASSTDGINFVLDEGKLIEPSTPGGLVTDPDVIKVNGDYRMYYSEFKKSEQELYSHEPQIMSALSSG